MGDSKCHHQHVCVLRDEDRDEWMVSLCSGPGTRKLIQRFPTREEAAEFAIAERDRLGVTGDSCADIQVPDDCPCYLDP